MPRPEYAPTALTFVDSDDEQLLNKDPVVLVKSESRSTGTVKSETYHAYVKAGGG